MEEFLSIHVNTEAKDWSVCDYVTYGIVPPRWLLMFDQANARES